MFGLFRRSGPRPLSAAISVAVEKDTGSLSAGSSAPLQMVESNGRYSDRKVTYFRVFDPGSRPSGRSTSRRSGTSTMLRD